jgi:Protein of unknown function (DUF2721)
MLALTEEVSTIAHVIELAIAPVFLITGIGALLGVMSNRLARIIEDKWQNLDQTQAIDAGAELISLAKRAKLASIAINFCAFAALMVCLLIATLFIDAFIGKNLRWFVGGLFVLSMFSLSGGIVCFLREVHVAMLSLRIGLPIKVNL